MKYLPLLISLELVVLGIRLEQYWPVDSNATQIEVMDIKQLTMGRYWE